VPARIFAMASESLTTLIARRVVELDVEGCRKACEQALEKGLPPMKILSDGLAKGMQVVGEKYASREFFLPELIVAGDVFKESMEALEPHLEAGDASPRGKVVIGTVKGDVHDIGKNIVAMLLRAAGFEVIDLGANVDSTAFVKGIREYKPRILGMSTLLSTCMFQMEAAVKELEKSGLRKDVRVIIGGPPITSEFARKIGADYGALDAVDGVNKCKMWFPG
jgi:5-methyltetrahydrofolate--homocysteine methyltransferase